MRWIRLGITALVLTFLAGFAGAGALVASAPNSSATSPGNVLYAPNTSVYPNEDASYPRVIRLAHQSVAEGGENGDLLATFSHSGNNAPASFPIYLSTNGGSSWSTSPISTVTDTVNGWDLDGPTLFELPQAEGNLPAGTILAAGTAWIRNNYTQQAIEVFDSTDGGHTWTYRSSCASESGQPNTQGHGIWEPEFNVDANGDLVCYFSDERPSVNGYNQVIAQVVSTDGGATWGAETYDVAVNDGVQRPGMSTVVKLPNGQYMMSFEDCKAGYNPDEACSVYVKTSPDGVTWTPTSSLGTLVQTADGKHFLHTPFLAWSPGGGPDGTLIISGQRVVTGPDGSVTVQPESGATLMINTNLGSGPWSEIPAPFVINPTGGYDSGETACPGYSSPILPSVSGNSLLYLAGVGISNGHCEVLYGTTGIGGLPFYAPFSSGMDNGWTTYGGAWSVANGGVYQDTTEGPGDKSASGSTGWTNYTVSTDVQLNSAGQAGLIFRVSDPAIGADALQGYYAGIESSSGNLILGKEDNGYTGIATTAVPGGVAVGTWYHLTAEANGCNFTLTLTPVGSTAVPTTLTGSDSSCFASGQVGVRAHYTLASFRNVTAVPSNGSSTASSYLAPFASGSSSGWTTYGGAWSVSGSTQTYADSSGGAGDKSISSSGAGDNSTVSADVEVTANQSSNDNPGILARVSNPSVGPDALNGYYAGLNVTSGQLVLGRETGGWTELASGNVPGGITSGQWYHVSLTAEGCELTAAAQSVNSWDSDVLVYDDPGCTVTTGDPGVRTFYAAAAWRYFQVNPG